MKKQIDKRVKCFACKKPINIDDLGGVLKMKDREAWIHSKPECLIVLSGSYPTPK